jgi:eukaryotic-like serine/threonine-protein kinase
MARESTIELVSTHSPGSTLHPSVSIMPIVQLGRFKITGILGKGAMGIVYRAHDPLIDRTVAIKTIGCAGLSSEETKAFEERFYCEAKSAGRLNHPNIVTIHDAGRTDDLAYIAMEFLNGRTLQEILEAGVALPPERCAEIAARIADGLAFAHANDVVHRDIKPANIMVFDNGQVKIADFGVAMIPTGAKTVDGMTYGSPKYMSPEQINGLRVDGRSDIFSLGAVLYEMLTGRPAFSGDNLSAILFQVLNSAPPLPSSFNASIPSGFDRIVARALVKDPDKRYQNASQLANDLRRLRRLIRSTRKDQAANDPSVSANGKFATTARKSGTVFRLLGIGLPIIAIVGIAAWYAGYFADELPPTSQTTISTEVAQTTTPAPLAAADAAPPPAQLTAEEPPNENQNTSSPPAELAEKPVETAAIENPDTAQRPGIVQFAIAPWGEVHVNGKLFGVSPPLSEIRLPPGKHRIEIRNGTFTPYQRQIDLTSSTKLRIKYKFE